MKWMAIKEGIIYEGCNGTKKLAEHITGENVQWRIVDSDPRKIRHSQDTGVCTLKYFAAWAYSEAK
jgi:hypothetical protein